MEAYWILMGVLSLCGLSLGQKECGHTLVNFDFPGSDFEYFHNVDLEHCQRKCKENPRCHAYTLTLTNNRCHLKEFPSGRRPYMGPLAGATTGYYLRYCTCAPWDKCPVRYHYVNQKKSWTEAQRYCREHHKDLATIINEDDMAQVDRVAGNSPNFWIGLHGSWEWCLDDEDFYGDGEVDFRYWMNGDPDLTNEQSCALVHESTNWTDAACTDPHVVICYSNASQKHILVDTPMSWFDGQKYCRKNYADLTSIRNQEENTNASSLLEATNAAYAWIGLQRNWMWSDGSHAPYRKWGHRQPHGDAVPGDRHEKTACASVDTNKEWRNTGCSEKLPFVCYDFVPDVMKRVVKVQLMSPAGSMLNLNHPDTLQKAILEQIKNRVAEQGHYGELKMSWKTQPDGKIFHKNVCEDDSEQLKEETQC